MAAVRAMALICESLLWMLLHDIGYDAHILDVLPTIWPTALAFFEQFAASPAAVIFGALVEAAHHRGCERGEAHRAGKSSSS
eukprot:3610982-Pleurochrysis_carterae.AAC.3